MVEENAMQFRRNGFWVRIALPLVTVLLLAGFCVAQQRREVFEAKAIGQGNQLGMSIGVTIRINSYSPATEQTILWEAFESGGKAGLWNALIKLPSKGLLSFSGVADYEVIYVREFPAATGRKLRIVARRPVALGGIRGTDYNLAAVQFDLGTDKSTGTFLPDCEFSLGKDTGVEVQAYQNPWRLDNITVTKTD